jgi:hypothetical protein
MSLRSLVLPTNKMFGSRLKFNLLHQNMLHKMIL